MSDQGPPDAMARLLLLFDGFTLDTDRGVLTIDRREVVLRPKTSAVLAHLLLNAGEVVPREALLDAVWPDVAVTDDSLTQCISEIRRALGEPGPRLLQTLPRRGYLLSAEVRRVTRPLPGTEAARPLRRRPERWLWLGLAAGLAMLGAGYALWPAPHPGPAEAAALIPAESPGLRRSGFTRVAAPSPMALAMASSAGARRCRCSWRRCRWTRVTFQQRRRPCSRTPTY